MPGLVKIGKTARDDIRKRLTELYTTGVPFPFECAFAGYAKDFARVESALHKAFDNCRENKKREFFKIEVEQAIAILELLVTEQITTDIAKEAEEVDPESMAAGRRRRPNFNFIGMGIPLGAELTFKDDERKCEVIDEKKVRFEGEEHSLTSLTRKLLNIRNVAPTRHWLYEGRSLDEIYNETYE